MTRERVGVRDVAARAGVSSQTVSRVINDHPYIRPETRARVLAAMDALGYRVNNAARSLGTSRTRTLGVLASDAALYGPAVGIAALEAAARAAGRWISTTYADGADAASVAAALDHLLDQGVDGIVVVAPHTVTLDLLASHAPGVPLAVLHGGDGAGRQAEGAALAVDHLVGLGHRRIARVAGPASWSEAVAREAGIAAALARHGVDAGPSWEGDWSAASGAALAGEVARALREKGGPTGIVVANDQMALGLIAGLVAHDVGVPAHVSIVGFDDNPDAAYYRPALTTVRLDIAGEARRCVGEVMGMPASVPAAVPVLLDRSSTAALR